MFVIIISVHCFVDVYISFSVCYLDIANCFGFMYLPLCMLNPLMRRSSGLSLVTLDARKAEASTFYSSNSSWSVRMEYTYSITKRQDYSFQIIRANVNVI